MNVDVNTLITLILGGGTVGTITAFFNGYKSLRDGARTREKSTIEDLISQRKKAYEERDTVLEEKNYAYDLVDFWRNRSADLEFILRQEGIATPPRKPEPEPGSDCHE